MTKPSETIKNNNSILYNAEILFGVGHGTVSWLEKSNIKMENIKYLFITNYCASHFSDIAIFLLERLGKSNLSLLKIIGPEDIKERVVALMILLDNDIKSNSVDSIEKTYNVEFIGLNNVEYISSDLKVRTYSIKDKNIQRNSYAVQYNNEEIYNN